MDSFNQSLRTVQYTTPASLEEMDEAMLINRSSVSEREWVDMHLDTLIQVHARLKQYCDFFATGLLRRMTFADFCVFCYRNSMH
jgi:hypothetical protein